MQEKILKINKNKSGSGSVSTRIVLPASWVKSLDLDVNIKAYYDEENKQIILKKYIDNDVR